MDSVLFSVFGSFFAKLTEKRHSHNVSENKVFR